MRKLLRRSRLRCSLNGFSSNDDSDYEEIESGDLKAVLGKLHEDINQPINRNFQVMPDLRVFAGESLYLIKPMQLRFWLRSTDLADAKAIALAKASSLLRQSFLALLLFMPR